METMILLGAIFCLNNFLPIWGSSILAFMPSPYGSHISTYRPLFKELAARGHNVTFYTGIPFEQEVPNIKQIVIDFGFGKYFDNKVKNDPKSLTGWQHLWFTYDVGLFVCENLFKHSDIQALIQSTDLHFDVILAETLFTHESFIPLSRKFNAPIVHLHPFRDEVWISELLRNPQPLSYIPNFRLPATDRMSFYERAYNVMLYLMQIGIGYLYYLPRQDKMMRDYFRYPGMDELPPLIDQLRNTSLCLLDGSNVISFVSPLLPNLIPVGGIHISNKPLPRDIEVWMNDAPNGVIYLSLGSLLKVSDMKPKDLEIFLKVLGQLPQKVLWKWEKNENIPGQPPNVKTSKWFPQMDILAHPKCRAFITHGGFHSVLEAAYFGVPIVGTPIFADQEGNLIIAEKNGFGQLVKFETLTEHSLSTALDRVLNDDSFHKNAKKLSSLLRDVPLTPMETAVYWVEHVLKHKGVPHLIPAGLFLPWYQYYLIDLFALVLTVFLSFSYLLCKILQFVFRWRVSKKSVKNKKKKA